MATTEFKDLALLDPLSEVARKERKLLLGIGMLAVLVAKTGLVPTKISALGVELSVANQSALLSLFSLVVFYFLAAFLIYGISDLLAWRRAIRRQRIEFEKERLLREREDGPSDDVEQEAFRMVREHGTTLVAFMNPNPISYVRAAFEFGVPVAFGLYAIYVLLSATP